jgi:hypothetical protein
VDREATVEERWTFAGFRSGYGALLGASQQPLGPDSMLDLAGQAGLTELSLVLDAACHDASASLPLVGRFGCRLLGVDLARHGFAARRRTADGPALGGRLRYVQGRLEALPVATGACDLVWCRDALSCAPCRVALGELARVAAPGATRGGPGREPAGARHVAHRPAGGRATHARRPGRRRRASAAGRPGRAGPRRAAGRRRWPTGAGGVPPGRLPGR